MNPEQRFTELNLEVPPPAKAMGVYRPMLVVGKMAYLSGHGPLLPSGKLITGRVGDNLNQQQGYDAARQTGLAMLATVRDQLASLDHVDRLVKTFGMVQCAATFKEIPAVINGFSELMRDVFGDERGVAARSAVGMYSLPGDIAVEIECVFELA